jgi:hypothetical protein
MNESKGNPGQSDTPKNDEPVHAYLRKPLSPSIGAGTLPGRRAVLGCVTGALIASLTGCATSEQAATTRIHWNEEVELADGRVIVVRQGRGTSHLYNAVGDVVLPTLASLRFTLPDIQASPIEWSDRFMPLILNLYEGALYVGGSPLLGRHFREFGRPRSGWVVQRHNPTTNGWDRIPASQTPEPIRKTNLLIDRVPPSSVKLISIEVKNSAQYNGRSRIDAESRELDPTRRSTYSDGLRDSDLTD